MVTRSTRANSTPSSRPPSRPSSRVDRDAVEPTGDTVFDRLSRGEAAAAPNETAGASRSFENRESRPIDDTAPNNEQTDLIDVPATCRRLDDELSSKFQAELARTCNELASTTRQQVSALESRFDTLAQSQEVLAQASQETQLPKDFELAMTSLRTDVNKILESQSAARARSLDGLRESPSNSRARQPEGPSEQPRARVINLETRSIQSVHSQPRQLNRSRYTSSCRPS